MEEPAFGTLMSNPVFSLTRTECEKQLLLIVGNGKIWVVGGHLLLELLVLPVLLVLHNFCTIAATAPEVAEAANQVFLFNFGLHKPKTCKLSAWVPWATCVAHFEDEWPVIDTWVPIIHYLIMNMRQLILVLTYSMYMYTYISCLVNLRWESWTSWNPSNNKSNARRLLTDCWAM